jgi:hypothetical protein
MSQRTSSEKLPLRPALSAGLPWFRRVDSRSIGAMQRCESKPAARIHWCGVSDSKPR